MIQQLELQAKFIRGFSDKTRLAILHLLLHEEKTVTQIVDELQGNQSNISQHLSCLKGCGIIVSRQDGKFVYYSLRNEQVRTMLITIGSLFEQVQEEAKCCERPFGEHGDE
ncbi:winged helix-turn-helix transcriptional regulator [Paenibacillus sp. GSMTC-2017]|uniref:ArsR/SmtB family transcription factor n=1 Tax=Paenibacillus sp. GSMTC-2017 TaxID=2794350 RepID=UPI0018D6BE86|nr:metalloregulator ArsR/SmtB family transcription factor [Paenibacillus sp. GSMTC-2017]MBH5318635.1 winged helix-turn-helix transcriptional regulator [Paenibacillus sp. GSMTC-2017]